MVISKVTLERAQEWCRWDPNETTEKWLQGLLNRMDKGDDECQHHCDADSDATQQLSLLFPEDSSRIGFGTAGLRAAMDIGPMRMNDLVVVQTAQGIARYCQQEQMKSSEQAMKIVIGYDHRSNPELGLSSLSFAILSVLVFQQAGIECILLDGFVATPMIPFCTTRLKAAAGIMVTASHNPKEDAGYKVYWSDGCQIRPPVDKGIARSILENLTPWADYRQLLADRCQHPHSDSPTLGLSDPVQTESLRAQYFDAIRMSGLVSGQGRLYHSSSSAIAPPPTFCYTAMHGVGRPFAEQIFSVFGLPPFVSVPQQEVPDPTFPTVAFPNPEEKGALDMAKAHAELHGCDVVLANDPDADRLAVAERSRETGEWTVFTGDQIGALLGSWLWNTIGKTSDKPIAMCASTVSSRLLAEMARVEGFHFEDTLTGFKWIGSRAATLNAGGKFRSIFCYEEAIGFCCGDVIFDKDGISALGVFAELTYSVYSEGSSLTQHLQRLYDKYGEFVSHNGYYYFQPDNDGSIVSKIFADMRQGGAYCTAVGPYPIESIRDLGEPGYDSTTPDQKPTLPTSKSSPMLTITFTNGCVAQFRASGTEPKFKYYIEMRGNPGVSRDSVQKELMDMSAVLLKELLKPDENGLSTTSRKDSKSKL